MTKHNLPGYMQQNF